VGEAQFRLPLLGIGIAEVANTLPRVITSSAASSS
jgi:hypothetical protein